jgi:hypothetical protein
MWKTRQGKGCLVHEFRPEGWKGAPMVVIQRPEGCIPRAGGETLPGHWPGHIGAAKKAVTTHHKEQESMTSTNELALREAKARAEKAEAEAALAKAKLAALQGSNKRTAVAVQAQRTYSENWDLYGRHTVEPNTYVKKITGKPGQTYTYVAVLHGEVIGQANGKYGKRARNAAKAMVTRRLG